MFVQSGIFVPTGGNVCLSRHELFAQRWWHAMTSCFHEQKRNYERWLSYIPPYPQSNPPTIRCSPSAEIRKSLGSAQSVEIVLDGDFSWEKLRWVGGIKNKSSATCDITEHADLLMSCVCINTRSSHTVRFSPGLLGAPLGFNKMSKSQQQSVLVARQLPRNSGNTGREPDANWRLVRDRYWGLKMTLRMPVMTRTVSNAILRRNAWIKRRVSWHFSQSLCNYTWRLRVNRDSSRQSDLEPLHQGWQYLCERHAISACGCGIP